MIMIIDGKNFTWRALSSLRNPIVTNDGVDATAIWNGIRMLSRLCNDWNPNAVIFLWEVTFVPEKQMLLPTYKRSRVNEVKDANMELWKRRVDASIPRFKEVLNMLGFIQYESPAEADDAAAYVTTRFKGQELLLVSSDKDWLHFCDHATVLLTRRMEFATTKDNFQQLSSVIFGLSPNYSFPYEGYRFIHACNGDDGDCVPGCKNAKIKTAIEVVQKIPKEQLTQLSYIKEEIEKYVSTHMTSRQKFILDAWPLLVFNWDFLWPYFWSNELCKKFDDTPFTCTLSPINEEEFCSTLRYYCTNTPMMYWNALSRVNEGIQKWFPQMSKQ